LNIFDDYHGEDMQWDTVNTYIFRNFRNIELLSLAMHFSSPLLEKVLNAL